MHVKLSPVADASGRGKVFEVRHTQGKEEILAGSASDHDAWVRGIQAAVSISSDVERAAMAAAIKKTMRGESP